MSNARDQEIIREELLLMIEQRRELLNIVSKLFRDYIQKKYAVEEKDQ